MTDSSFESFTADELAAEGGTALPAKEVMSLLDLNANLDLGLDVAAPIDLAVGANANIAAPINAAVGANILSAGSVVGGGAAQAAEIHQGVTGDAHATAMQNSGLSQTQPTTPGTPVGSTTTPTPTTAAGALDGNLLNVNVNLNGNLHLAAPIDGAVAANANVAAPIDASVSANIGSVGSSAEAVAHQSALIDQSIHGNATAVGDQQSTINQ
ncbi:MAG: peptidoglycan-binding protein [Actinomycetota bacterium]|nr:peptidoglycan-binding protein [Actinomycetota bacterium]